MKVIIVIAALMFSVSACGDSSEYSEKDYDVAMVAFNGQEDPQATCDVIWMYDRAELKAMLDDAYDNGKPDGDIWVNVDIKPTKEQVRALVDIQFDYCKNL